MDKIVIKSCIVFAATMGAAKAAGVLPLQGVLPSLI